MLDTLGSICLERGIVALVIVHLQQAVALQPGNAQFHYQLARAYLASQETPRA